MQASEFIRSPLTASRAQQLAQDTVAAGREDRLAISVAVVDAGGHLLAFVRGDGAFLGSIEASMAKARTAVFFQRETAAMQQGLEQGKTAYLALPGALPLEGGVPLYADSLVVGALGVSGASSAQDGALARAAVAAAGFSRQPA